jgi:hypothetical protein
MGTYYRCAQGDVARIDAIYKEQVMPLLKTAQTAGEIASFGWAKHAEGGEWRRLLYLAGTNLEKLADARDALTKSLMAPEHVKAFRRVRPHVLLARRLQSGDRRPAPNRSTRFARVRAPFAMSTYFVCDAHEVKPTKLSPPRSHRCSTSE